MPLIEQAPRPVRPCWSPGEWGLASIFRDLGRVGPMAVVAGVDGGTAGPLPGAVSAGSPSSWW